MANTENPEGGRSPSQKPDVGLAIIATPFEGEQPQEKHFPDGGFTIFLRGEIYVAYQPPAAEATESPVPDAETPDNGLLPESTSPSVTEPHRAADKPSWEKSQADIGEIPESENQKFELVGNPARILGYRVTRKTNTRIADFVLATHPEEDTTEYWRIRAFGDQAEKVRDQVRKGQKGVEVTVYGPKYWKGRRKIEKGYEDTVVKGYHAGFVKVPKKISITGATLRKCRTAAVELTGVVFFSSDRVPAFSSVKGFLPLDSVRGLSMKRSGSPRKGIVGES